jgi:adenylylsulfate kinase-like enzyme
VSANLLEKRLHAQGQNTYILKNFTGIDSPYEAPLAPDVHLQSANADAVTLANQMTHFLDAKPVGPRPET